uniref:Uncharacterized protein n=1 Tax=Anguilla anguilla TaxID=7936 RepID=A0A0E9PGE6_ANGAN
MSPNIWPLEVFMVKKVDFFCLAKQTPEQNPNSLAEHKINDQTNSGGNSGLTEHRRRSPHQLLAADFRQSSSAKLLQII